MWSHLNYLTGLRERKTELESWGFKLCLTLIISHFHMNPFIPRILSSSGTLAQGSPQSPLFLGISPVLFRGIQTVINLDAKRQDGSASSRHPESIRVIWVILLPSFIGSCYLLHCAHLISQFMASCSFFTALFFLIIFNTFQNNIFRIFSTFK